MSTNIGHITHTERDAADTSVNVTRAYFQPHATLANTYVLGTSSGDATAWLTTTAGITQLDNDVTAETNVPFIVDTSTLVIL